MRRSRAVLAVAAALVLVVASGGFSTATVDRGVDLRVVDSENAFLGVEACERPAVSAANTADSGTATNGSANATAAASDTANAAPATGGAGNPVAVTVTNRFDTRLVVTDVAGYDDGTPVERTSAGQPFTVPLYPGDDPTRTLTFREPVDRLLIGVAATDGSLEVAVRVDVEAKSAPGC